MIFGKQVDLANNFRLVRIAEGKTLEFVAEATGVSKTYVSFVENGQKKPSDKYIKSFCGAFGIRESTFRSKTAEIKLNWK